MSFNSPSSSVSICLGTRPMRAVSCSRCLSRASQLQVSHHGINTSGSHGNSGGKLLFAVAMDRYCWCGVPTKFHCAALSVKVTRHAATVRYSSRNKNSLCWLLPPRGIWCKIIPDFCSTKSILFVFIDVDQNVHKVPSSTIQVEYCWLLLPHLLAHVAMAHLLLS